MPRKSCSTLYHDAIMAGANLALIGDELIQFGRAEQLGPGLFRLSHLLRGRRGTEWAAAGHSVGDVFCLRNIATHPVGRLAKQQRWGRGCERLRMA
jgi:hypothetical protein